MTLSRQDLIREIFTHAWHEPVLRVLASGPRRYAEIRAGLIDLEGQSPGDGYISTELRDLRELGLLEQRPVAGARRSAWALTNLGNTALRLIDEIKKPEFGAQSTVSPGDGGSDGADRVERLTMDEIQARANMIDTSIAHPARRYNYWLGGKDHFQADRDSGDLILKAYPTTRMAALENRRFLQRAVQYLAQDAGVDQFLDIGTGLPTADNTHEVAQRINPHCRVAYVDNDRIQSGCVHTAVAVRPLYMTGAEPN